MGRQDAAALGGPGSCHILDRRFPGLQTCPAKDEGAKPALQKGAGHQQKLYFQKYAHRSIRRVPEIYKREGAVSRRRLSRPVKKGFGADGPATLEECRYQFPVVHQIPHRYPGGILCGLGCPVLKNAARIRSEEHTSELQSPDHLVCRLLLEKKNKTRVQANHTPTQPAYAHCSS